MKRRVKRRFHRQKNKVQKAKRNNIPYFLLSLSMVFLFFMTACGGGSSPPSFSKIEKPIVVEKKVEPVKVVEKENLEKKGETEYSYNPIGKPDPFKPFIQLTTIKELKRNVPLTPLQKYDISQLKLVAIIVAPEGNFALVEDSLGKGYCLKKGTRVGTHDGKVKKILKDKVIIEEMYEDISGQEKMNEISLFLHRVEEGGES